MEDIIQMKPEILKIKQKISEKNYALKCVVKMSRVITIENKIIDRRNQKEALIQIQKPLTF